MRNKGIWVMPWQGGLTMLLVWVHDYHLLLVPGMVREKLPKARIGLFIHAPFPSSEIFRCLPSEFFKIAYLRIYILMMILERQEILKGMLGANLVGFQVRHWIHQPINNPSHPSFIDLFLCTTFYFNMYPHIWIRIKPGWCRRRGSLLSRGHIPNWN